MEVFFPPFRLDLSSEQLWREEAPLALRPKTFAVLRYLVEHPGKLVTKDDLLDAVWAGTVVSDTVLKSCIRELRTVLGDTVQSPQYIATVHRRGYRFIGKGVSSYLSQPAPVPRSPTPNLVGREAELTQLQSWLDKALCGERQLVFVTGEAGIGKTTLIEVFVSGVRGLQSEGKQPPASKVQGRRSEPAPNTQSPTPVVWLGWGQCIEQYGASEAYMPILEALGRLCHETGGERLLALLNQHAPTWLVQMPTLLNTTELEILQRKVQGATRERMLREMGEAVDAITAERPLILWLEDLHWSDPSTLELLALLARRGERARLLVLGTYRPVDVIVKEHPLRAVKQELQLHGQCEELAVRLLSEEHIAEYLAARILVPSPANAGEPVLSVIEGEQGEGLSAATLSSLAHAIHERTEGNPLFMINVVDELLAQGKIDGTAVKLTTPVTIRQMIERQLERLNLEEQRVLEVASVAGMVFSSAAVAAGAEATVECSGGMLWCISSARAVPAGGGYDRLAR